MKLNIKNSTFILMGILFLLSCSLDSSIKNQFEAERMLYKANKLYQRVMINPNIATASDYENTISAYEKIISRYELFTSNVTIENIKKQCYIVMAELWLFQGEIQSAIKVYDKFLKIYPNDKTLGTYVHFANAKSNEKIFNLNKAVSEYQSIIDDFGQIQDPLKPNQNIMRLPLKVARLKRSNTLNTDKQNIYQRALSYYDSIVKKWPNSPAVFMAEYYKSSIYYDQQKWNRVIATLNNLVKEYPEREEIPNILLSIGNIYLDGLNNPRQANWIYENFLKKYKDHPLEGYVHFAKSKVFIKQGNYQKARKLLAWIIEEYPQDQNLCSSAQLTIASTYEAEGNWERALVEYHWLQENYPLTNQGLYIPTYIAEYYRNQGEKNLAKTSYKEAVEHYSHLAKKYPKTILAASAQEYIIYCFSAQEKWQQAASAAIALRGIQPSTRSNISSYLLLGQIYEKLNEFKKAIDVYEQFSKEFPEHPIVSQIQDRIEIIRKRI